MFYRSLNPGICHVRHTSTSHLTNWQNLLNSTLTGGNMISSWTVTPIKSYVTPFGRTRPIFQHYRPEISLNYEWQLPLKHQETEQTDATSVEIIRKCRNTEEWESYDISEKSVQSETALWQPEMVCPWNKWGKKPVKHMLTFINHISYDWSPISDLRTANIQASQPVRQERS